MKRLLLIVLIVMSVSGCIAKRPMLIADLETRVLRLENDNQLMLELHKNCFTQAK